MGIANQRMCEQWNAMINGERDGADCVSPSLASMPLCCGLESVL